MILRYLIYLIFVDGLGHLSAFFVFPFAYVFRANPPKFLWYYLNDAVGIYGDVYFQERYRKSETKLGLFILAYHWCAWRNALQNWYNSHRIEGEQILIKSVTTCHRPNVLDAMWRTVKYKNKDGSFADKYGTEIDYEHSILGKQWYLFTINGKRYFRKSGTVIKQFKRFTFIHEYKFGFQDHNWAFQFRVRVIRR